MSSPRVFRLTPFMLVAFTLLLWASVSPSAYHVQAQEGEPDPAKLEQGGLLYVENCALCHGEQGEGRIGATLAQNWPSIRPSATVEEIIRRGIPGTVMPAWSEEHGGPLNDEQIDALVAYILSWQTGEPRFIPPTATFTPPQDLTPPAEIEGDAINGAGLFIENCAVCHGERGEGRVGATLAINWPSIRPDLTVKSTISNGIEGSVMPAWSQENGGPLREEQINDLVAYILALPAAQVNQVSPTAVISPSPVSVEWLRGWGGVVIFVVLFVVIIAAALIAQRATD